MRTPPAAAGSRRPRRRSGRWRRYRWHRPGRDQWGRRRRLMDAHDEVTLVPYSAEFTLGPLVEPSTQGDEIDAQDEDGAEEVDELSKVPGPAAEECGRSDAVACKRANRVDIPDVVPVRGTPSRRRHCDARRRISLIGKVRIAVHGVVPAPAQLRTHRRLTAARHPGDEIVAPTHDARLSAPDIAFQQVTARYSRPFSATATTNPRGTPRRPRDRSRVRRRGSDDQPRWRVGTWRSRCPTPSFASDRTG